PRRAPAKGRLPGFCNEWCHPVRWRPVVRQTILPAPGPVRTCVGCRRRAAKSELLRVVAGKGADGRAVVVPDPTATAPGRGAHVHPTLECLQLAVRRRAFPRALRAGEGMAVTPLEDHLT